MEKFSTTLLFLLFIVTIQLSAGGNFILASEASTPDILPQLSSDGNLELSLRRVNQRKGVITVQAIVKNISGSTQTFKFDYKDAYLIALETNKKYLPLKDEKGQFIAGPTFGASNGGYIRQSIDTQGKAVFWIKFPAPTEQVQEIDCFIPGFTPFEGISLQ